MPEGGRTGQCKQGSAFTAMGCPKAAEQDNANKVVPSRRWGARRRQGMLIKQDSRRQDKIKDKTRQHETRRGETGRDKARQDTTRQNKTRQHKTTQHHKTTQDLARGQGALPDRSSLVLFDSTILFDFTHRFVYLYRFVFLGFYIDILCFRFFDVIYS